MIGKELGNILYHHKNDFVSLLNESGISASINTPNQKLIDDYVDNISNNKKLAVGTSILLGLHNKQSGFPGATASNNNTIKSTFNILKNTFAMHEKKSNAEGFSNAPGGDASDGGASDGGGSILGQTAQGTAGGGVVGAIAGAIGGIANFGAASVNAKAKKAEADNKIFDLLQKKSDLKNSIISGVIGSAQADKEAKAKAEESKKKTLRVGLIIGGVVVGLVAIGLTVYFIRKKKK